MEPIVPLIVMIIPDTNKSQHAIYKNLDKSLPLLNFIIIYPGKTNPNVPVHDQPIKLINDPKSFAKMRSRS